MIATITIALLLARISVVAVGESVRLLGSLLLLLVGRPGITAQEAQPSLPKPEPEPVVITASVAKPFVYREALQRDRLTGQLV